MSDEGTTENDTVTEKEATSEAAGNGNNPSGACDEENVMPKESPEELNETQQSAGDHDSTEESQATDTNCESSQTNITNEITDGPVDAIHSAEEPMEVDEVSNESEHRQEISRLEESQNDDERESNENVHSEDVDGQNAKVCEHHEESCEMEVDCETPQGEDVPDFAKNTDEPDVEHSLEQLNCSNLSESTSKEQTVSDDPFDSLMKTNDTNTPNETQIDSNENVDNNEEEEDPAGSEYEDNDQDTSSHHDGSNFEAVDFIEEGRGADEELLPYEDREISDADKERAIQNQQQADDIDDPDNEPDDSNLIEGNGEKVPSGQSDMETNKSTLEYESSEHLQADAPSIPITPNFDEIKEIESEANNEHLCVECGQTTKCKYALLKEVIPVDNDSGVPVASEIQYLCDTRCVTKFNDANAQYKIVVKKVPIYYTMDTEQKCDSCEQTKICRYRYKETTNASSLGYICEDDCLNNFTVANPDRFVIAKKRFIIEEVSDDERDKENKCLQCSEEIQCKYTFKEDDNPFYVCADPCLNLLMAEQPDRFRFKRQSIRVKDLSRKTTNDAESTPREQKSMPAEKAAKMKARTEDEQRMASLDREASFSRRCAQCYSDVMLLEPNLQWETMDFCNESCLGQYQQQIGAACQACQSAVSVSAMGKYCVRFGFELRQFCRSACLDSFKKGLKVCSYCQSDIAKNDEFLAPINGQFKDFCSKACMRLYEPIFSAKKHSVKTCAVCNNSRKVYVQFIVDANVHNFCSNPCFSAFSFVNNVSPDCCAMCKKYFERKSSNAHTIFQGSDAKLFCSKICMNIFIIANREIAPCQWCKVRKYNFDMIQKISATHGAMMLCSINCLSMCEVSMNAIAMKQQKCDQCNSLTTPQYHLTMSDASMRNFCTYQCVMAFQSQFSRQPLTLEGEAGEQRTQPVPTGLPKRIRSQQQQKSQAQSQNKSKSPARSAKTNNYQSASSNTLVISSVTSLASTRNTRRSNQTHNSSIELNRLQPIVELEPLPESVIEKTSRPVGRPRNSAVESQTTTGTQIRVEKQTQIVTIPPLPKKVANISTMCTPSTHNKEVQARSMQFTVGCQTESYLERKMVIPIPVPIYLPSPMPMYAQPFPVPVPIPLPIPVPVFIPTTRNSANGIMKEIKKIQDKMPADPYEAELLMMAEMVAGDRKKEEETDSSEDENEYHNEGISTNNFGEDIMQMALKMATEYDPAGVDLEASMQANTITPHSHPGMAGHDVMHNHQMMLLDDQRTGNRKRGPTPRAQRQPVKRSRRGAIHQEVPQPELPREPIEKADANMCLKFTFGVNAWKQWVMTKNSELEKSTMRRKLFKTELLQLTADELNYSLCLFVKEVRKPNGSEYAPDTIYYLVLGIQEYLYENGRIDNIFTDPYYERFTDCLDEVAKKFSVLYNDSQYIVTRVEEEHLWECKQLGAHSPHVLLSTLMFFNTKHFNLTTVDEHMQLSFSHIMKHWKRNPNQGGKVAGSRNVLLRFYPPQSSHIDNSRKKKVYEQQENEENPLRCPVKLYEFYLSKCPESVKTRNDVFYLLPERSCVPDSPVWYSTQALNKEALSKMLHRVKMVKEINIALLTS